MPSVLTIEERNRLIGNIEAGSKPADVAETFGVTKRTVYRLIKKSKEYGTLKDRPRSGRPRVTDVETDTQIVGKFRDHPFKTARSAAIETNVSERTVVRRLASAGVKACRPAVKPMLNAQHKLNRMIWARGHVRWTREQWASVLF